MHYLGVEDSAMHIQPKSIIGNTSVTKNLVLKPGAANSTDHCYFDVEVTDSQEQQPGLLTVTLHPKAPFQLHDINYHLSFKHLDWRGWVPWSGEMAHTEWTEREQLVFRKKNTYRIIQILEARWSSNQLVWNAQEHSVHLNQQFQGLAPSHSMPLLQLLAVEGTSAILQRTWQNLSDLPVKPNLPYAMAWMVHNEREVHAALERLAERPGEAHLFVLDTRNGGLSEAAQPHWKSLLRELKSQGHNAWLYWNPWTQALQKNRTAVNPWEAAVQTEVANTFHALCTEQGFPGVMVHSFDAVPWQCGPGRTTMEARQAAIQWLADQATHTHLVYEGLELHEAWPCTYDALQTVSPATFKKHPVTTLRALAQCEEKLWKGNHHFYYLDPSWLQRKHEPMTQSILTAIHLLGGIPMISIPDPNTALDALWNALALSTSTQIQWKWHPQLLELQGTSDHCYINLSARSQQLPGQAFTLAGFESIALRQAL